VVQAAEAVVIEPVLEPAHGDDGLRLEGRGALDDAAAIGHGEREQQQLDVSGQLVLAALPGYLDGEGEA